MQYHEEMVVQRVFDTRSRIHTFHHENHLSLMTFLTTLLSVKKDKHVGSIQFAVHHIISTLSHANSTNQSNSWKY